MKTLLSICIAWFLVISPALAQVPSIDKIKTEPATLTTGYSFKLHSSFLNEDRTVMIYLPDNYNTTTKKYPVLYMLDGQWNFSHTAQTAGWLSDKGFMPQTIVVGIHTGGDNRSRDLLPTQDKQSKSGGGADVFYKFIKEELIPFVDKNYRTYNYKVLGGVSFGGVFVMYAFITDPQLFNSYLVQSPSMWWDNKILLNKTESFLSKNPKLDNNLYLAMANEGIQMGVDSLSELLKKYAPKELKWKYDKYPEEVHETVNYKGTWNGLKFVFTDWYYPFVNFGTKGDLFSPQDSAFHPSDNHKSINLSSEILNKYSGLYKDSYKRILSFTERDSTLIFSGFHLPEVTLSPETENKFFIKDAEVQNKLFMKGYNIQFEFINDDSLVVKANGKIECTAKKIIHRPLVNLSDGILKLYVGKYESPGQSEGFKVVYENNNLKAFEKETLLSYLYPLGEQEFYAFINGSGYELEFVKDDSNTIIKVNISMDGKKIFESKRIN